MDCFRKSVVTRKPHVCFGCAIEYAPKTEMERFSVADNGTIFSGYTCPVCQEYVRRYFSYGDEYGYSELRSNDIELWELLKTEMEDENGYTRILPV